MDRAGDSVGRSAQCAGQRGFGEHLGDRGADQMRAQQAVLLVEKQLDESVAVARSRGFARGGEGEAPDLVGDAPFAELLFGLTDRGHFGMGEDTRRHGRIIHRCGVEPADGFHAADTLGRCDVGQSGASTMSPMA